MSVTLALLMGTIGANGHLIIADNGKSDFIIVVGRKASPSEKHAADELQHFLEEISGARLPIKDDSGPLAGHEIILGDNAHLRRTGVKIDFAKLGKEGFTIRTAPPHLIIAGGRLRGTMYGVYTFLEDHLGCKWLAPDCSIIPKRDRIEIGPINDTQVPVLEYREPFYKDAFDPDWCARNKMNSSHAPLDEAHGGKVTYYGFVHTFNSLLPPEKYFDKHPEYYSMVNGKRIRDHTQLCCTNPEVKRLVAEEVLRRMRAHPEATVFSVSQNDWGNWCQCPRCTAVAEREGSQIGPILELVNYVADYVRKEFPDKIIDTLAYHYSRKPPKHIRPRPNVVVRLCSIECCFSHPLATGDSPANAAFRRDIQQWAKVCNRLWVWDYVVDFHHYLLPFPNLQVLKPNIQFFVRNNVKGIFEEGDYNTVNGEFAKLRAWMLAKFLWNPDYPYEKALTEFLEGYYGAAAGPLRQYIDMLQDKVKRDDIHVYIWAGPDAPYLTDEILARANRLFDEAERLVSSDPVRLKRVQIARLPLYYVALERYRPKPATHFVLAGDFFKPENVDPRLAELWDKFTTIAKLAGLTHVGEGGGRTLALYKRRKEPLIRGYHLVRLQGQNIEVSVAPMLAGRIVAISDLAKNRQLCYLGMPGDVAYPASAGYGGWWRDNLLGFGRREPFEATVSNGTITMTCRRGNGLAIQRKVRLEGSSGLVIHDTIINARQDTKPRRYWSQLRLNAGPGPVGVQIGGKATTLPAGDLGVCGMAVTRQQAAAGVVLALGDVGVKWAVTGDGMTGAGIYLDPSRNLLTLAARLDGQILPQGNATITWRLQLTRPPHLPAAQAMPQGLVVAQEDEFNLYREPSYSRVDFDPTATDGFAAWMGGNHHEWAVQWHLNAVRFKPGQAYDVFARVKVLPTKGKSGEAFTAGVYDVADRKSLAFISAKLDQVKPGQWQVWRIGRITPGDNRYVWLAPTTAVGNIQGMWVDWIAMRPAR